MVQAISDITVNQGIDPANAIIIGGGGAAGLNALTIAQRLGCKRLVIPEVGAALSAFGAVVSDIAREYRRVFVTSSVQFDCDGAAAVIAELRQRAKTFADAAGSAARDTRFDFLVEARYLHQVWEIDVTIDPERLLGSGGVDILVQDFNRAHEEIFAFSDPQSPIEVIAWRAAVRCAAAAGAELRLADTPTAARLGKCRRAFFPRGGWIEVPVLAFGEIEPGARNTGPAIVESPFTSIVIDPSAAFSRSASGDLIVEPGGAQSVADEAYVSVRGRT
jgi:N-methylhydantoinase A